MWKRSLIAGFVVAVLVLAQGLRAQSSAAATQAANSAKNSADLPPGPMQEKATNACTECHEARIIVQQRLSKAAWGREVDKMVKWGAVVDPKDRDALIDYLSTNFNTDKAAYNAERSAASSAGSKK